MITRRQFIKLSAVSGASFYLSGKLGPLYRALAAPIPGGTLDPALIPKYATPLVKPPVMPGKFKKNKDQYDIAVRQFQQHILPSSMGVPPTTVWSYGPFKDPRTVAEGGSYFYPAFTIEATWNKMTQVRWFNDLRDADENFLPHILPVDPTLHWANPIGMRDTRPSPADAAYWNHPLINQDGSYVGPVPIVTHVHGAHTYEQWDGYAEAWYLPDAANLPADLYRTGTFFDYFNSKYNLGWDPGAAIFFYPNDQRATTLWYHDHTLGMTRLNVYAGPAGFYLIRGGPAGTPTGFLPGPAPGLGDDPFGVYYEIPIVIQDRSFNDDGSLFYPDNRAFFEGLDPTQLQIPFIPDIACDGLPSDVSPIWQPEFFGNTMVVNGQTWPYLEVEQRRYRFRFLNGCNSRFLILRMDNDLPFYQIGSEGGFLPAPVALSELLIAPAERADVIVDFTNVPVGTEIILRNLAPDEPFGGGTPGVDFDPADPDTTGQVMQFRVMAATGPDLSTPPMDLGLPAITPLGTADHTRQVSLNEEESATVRVVEDGDGNIVLACDDPNAEEFGPIAALLGTLNPGDTGFPLLWSDIISENPALFATEAWEMYNFTEDAHPIHVHQVMFQVVNREDSNGTVRPPEPWETGWKDTVISYPDEITRIKARFDLPGFYVWHCHIVEHEDNEMMRPYHVGPIPPDAPAQ